MWSFPPTSQILQGLIAVGSSLGLVEIITEPSTTDGFVLASASTDPRDLVRAVDGLKLGTRHLEEAYKAGVLIAVTAPLSESVVAGESVAFKTGSESSRWQIGGKDELGITMIVILGNGTSLILFFLLSNSS